ncbi:MAG TPA: PH domain-containing protein [Chthoniobacteraceae bacterium]|jgi:DNA-directed RNA polymerase subunit RPC12/RpoP
MNIKFECPNCGQRIEAPPNSAGQGGVCPACQQPVLVPQQPPLPKSLPQQRSIPQRVEQHVAEATNGLRKFLNEEQDPTIVQKIHTRALEICTQGEDVKYIAVQKKPIVTLTPESVVLTNKRIIIFRQGLLGSSFQDIPWRDVQDIHVKEGLLGATFSVQPVAEHPVHVDSLPKSQARKLYQFAQGMEEQVHHQRRQRDLEDKRAAAGGIMLGTAVAGGAPAEDPAQKLQQLKSFHDQGLISDQEYEAKKADILSRF